MLVFVRVVGAGIPHFSRTFRRIMPLSASSCLWRHSIKRVDIALPSCDDEAAGMTAVASSFEGDPAIVSGMKSGDTS